MAPECVAMPETDTETDGLSEVPLGEGSGVSVEIYPTILFSHRASSGVTVPSDLATSDINLYISTMYWSLRVWL